MQALGESGSKRGGGPAMVVAGAMDLDEWMVRVGVMIPYAPVPVLARELPMTAVSRAMSLPVPSVAPP